MTVDPKNVNRLSVAIYGGLSMIGALGFFVVTIVTGDYSWVSRVGGTIWIFLLAMIILMPTVTPMVRAISERHLKDVGGRHASR